MFSRMTSSGFLATHVARLFNQEFAMALKPLGLAPAQFMVLIDLADGQPRAQGELAARLDVEQPTMTNTLNRMERDGLILREIKPGDRRVQLIRATQKALGLYRQAAMAAINVNERATRGLTTEERLRFLGTLAQVIDNLKGEKAAS
jgi:DNA-binding MarR family transcriptional regulator